MLSNRTHLLAIMAVAILTLFLGGAWYYRNQEEALRAETEKKLMAIGRIKAEQISQWRKERYSDAAELSESPFLNVALRKWINGEKDMRVEDVLARLQSIKKNSGYDDILVADANHKVRLSVNSAPEALDGDTIAAMESAFASQKPILMEIERDSHTEALRLRIVAPLMVVEKGVPQKTGAIILQVNPNRFLFPLVESWPVPSQTAETLLVRNGGTDVLFLNELRHRKNTALQLRIPLSNVQTPAVQAVLGKTGFFEGVDYRGVPVVAALLHVPDSPWFMVSKLDADEAFSEWRYRSLMILVALIGTGFFVVVATARLWERNAKEQYQRLFELESRRLEAEQQYRVTLHSIGDGVITTDAFGRVELLNAVSEELTGWAEAEAKGRLLDEVFPIANQFTGAFVENPIHRVLREGIIVGLANHTVLTSRDGTVRPIADSAAPIRTETGDIRGVVLVFRDQTQEYEAQRILAENEAQYRNLFNGMLDGFALHEVITDALGKAVDYRFLAVNPAFEKLTGMSVSQVTGKRVRELMPDLEPLWIERYGRVALTGEELHFEDYNRALDKYFEVFAYRPQAGQFACVFRDVTDRKRAQEAVERRILALTRPLEGDETVGFGELFRLEDIQQLQDQFATSAGLASLITDPSGKPITRPTNFCRLCEDIIRKTEKGAANCMKSDALLGSHHPDGPLVQPCLSCGLWDAGASIMVGGKHVASWLIGQVRDENQTEEAMRAYAREIGADEDALAAAFLEVTPMSREKFHQLAQTLHTLAGQLSTMAYQNVQQARFIADRKRTELENEELQSKLHHAQKIESVGRLAGGVAHDFNNMLSVILGHADLALSRMDPLDPLYEDLSEIRNAANRSADITRQLLAFARKQAVQPKVLDLNDAVAGSLKMLRRLIGEDIDLAWMPGAELGRVCIDPSQVDQILANLATNARDAIHGVGKITIETENAVLQPEYCEAHPGFAPGEYVLLSVSDSGAGMDKETLKNAFDPFFTTKPLGEGTGLGLATVYGIVKQNSGFVNVYSEPGQGTTFKIYLPRHEAAVCSATEVLAVDLIRGGTETILLVEDEPAILKLGRRILESLGYRVLAAGTPGEALRIAREVPGRIDLLLTDVIMPEMNGKDLANAISEVRPGIRCVFMSGYTANVIAHRGVLEPGVAFLQKPFTHGDMAQRVREALGGQA